MAQNDRDFPGTIDRGSAARLRILDVWEAQDTLNSGATAPTVTWPFMWWADTSANRLRQRNAGNSGWIDVMPLGIALDGRFARLAEANVFTQPQVVTTSLSVSRADSVAEGGRTIWRRADDNADAYQAQAFGTGATPRWRLLRLFGTPAQVFAVLDDGRAEIGADGINAQDAVRKGQLDAAIAGLPAPTVTVSATATVTTPVGQVDLTLPSGPAMFLLLIGDLRLSAAAQIFLRTSSDGVTFQSGASDYADDGSATVSRIALGTSTFAANDTEPVVGKFTIWPGAATTPRFGILGEIAQVTNIRNATMGRRNAAGRQQAIRIYPSTGNINRGTFRLIGIT